MRLDDNLGFRQNPFSKKSAEQELDVLENIFYEPNYYQALMETLSSGDSRFIIGQRGHGKTAVINKLVEDLERKHDLFVIKIDRFDTIPTKRNETAFLKLILKESVTKLGIFLVKNNHLINRLDASEKEKLAMLMRFFFKTLSKKEYTDTYNQLHKVKIKNWLIKAFNRFGLKPVNTLTSTAISVTSSFIRQSLNIDGIDSSATYTEYFGEVKEIDYSKIDIEKENLSKDHLKHFLDELLHIFKCLEFKAVVVLFDKIDEYQDLNQDVSRIATFTSEILSDTELLMNENLAIGFSLWSELKSELGGIVRFDKFGSIDVRWKDKDLEPLIDRRINFFSKNRNKTFKDLVPNELDRSEIIKLAYKSPRDLISLLSEIYLEQANSNQDVQCFDPSSITKGMINFCMNYDYDSLYSSKTGRNKEIKAMINRILTVRQTRFTQKQLTDTFNQTIAQSEGQIKLMTQYKLVREDDILGNNGAKYYEVIDPKIEYLIRRTITKIE